MSESSVCRTVVPPGLYDEMMTDMDSDVVQAASEQARFVAENAVAGVGHQHIVE